MNKARPGTALGTMIILLFISNLFGAWKLISDPARFSPVFDPLNSGQIRLIAIIPVVSLVALILLWRGKPAGLPLIIIAFTAVLLLDLYFGIWYHLVLAVSSFSLLYYFYRRSPGFR